MRRLAAGPRDSSKPAAADQKSAARHRKTDAASERAARQPPPAVSHTQGRPTHVPFDLDLGNLVPSRSLNLRVHIDLDEDGQVSTGDLLSQESCRIVDAKESIAISVAVVGQ